MVGRSGRREEHERGREPKSGQDRYQRSHIASSRRDDQSRGIDRKVDHFDLKSRESLERISSREYRSRSKELREKRRSLLEEKSRSNRESIRRAFDLKGERDQYQRKTVSDLGRGSKEKNSKSNNEISFFRESHHKGG